MIISICNPLFQLFYPHPKIFPESYLSPLFHSYLIFSSYAQIKYSSNITSLKVLWLISISTQMSYNACWYFSWIKTSNWNQSRNVKVKSALDVYRIWEDRFMLHYITTLLLCTVLFIKATPVRSLHANIHIVTWRGAVEQTKLMQTVFQSNPTWQVSCSVF